MNIVKVEQYLCKIRGVTGAKIILNEEKEIEEIHIIASISRNAKQIIRDIESILLTKYDTRVDHRKISVAQINEEMIDNNAIEGRLKLEKIEYSKQDKKATITVNLKKDVEIFEYTHSGINTSNNIKRLVGNSVLQAVHKYCDSTDIFYLESVKEVSVSDVKVILVLISTLTKEQEILLTGTSILKGDEVEAIAKATLNAVNRFIGRIIK